MQIILASQSPRRRELMGFFRLPFTVQAGAVDETMEQTKSPDREVARVSRLKAEAVCAGPGAVVIAADTIVVCDGKILGKPRDAREAREMLALLSGREHQVMTGVTVKQADRAETFTEITRVYFRPLSEKEILDYVATGEPMDKAGAYAIQGGGALFTQRLEGDYFNVMGLPVCRLGETLKRFLGEGMEEGS